MAKNSSRDTYDIDGLKVEAIHTFNGHFEDGDEMPCSTYILKNGKQEETITIENDVTFYNPRDGYGDSKADMWAEKTLVELLSIYRYLNNNGINHEIKDEIRSVIIPEKNLDNTRPNINKSELSKVYSKCKELKLTHEFNEEVKSTYENANKYYEENNKKLDKIARIKRVGAKVAKGSLYIIASPLLIAALPVVIGAELGDI